MPFETLQYLSLPDSAKLPFRSLETPQPKGVVQICHGMSEHSGRYARFATALSNHGYIVYAHDHRGHGYNIGRHAFQGSFGAKNGDIHVVGDVVTLTNYIRQRHPDLPIVLFGHSMGGIIALSSLLSAPTQYDALSVWNSNLGNNAALYAARALLFTERMLKGSDVPSQWLPKLTFEKWATSVANAKTPFDWLSHDENEVQAYIDDPLCGFAVTTGLWIDLFRLIERALVDRNFQHVSRSLPIHLLGGTSDPATNFGKAVTALAKRLERLGFSQIQHSILDNTRHESLNELNRDNTIENYLIWLDKIIYFENEPVIIDPAYCNSSTL